MVLVAVNSSDLNDVRIRGGKERFLPNGGLAYLPGPSWEWLYGTSIIFRHVVHGLLDYDSTLVLRDQRAATNERSNRMLFEAPLEFEQLAQTQGHELVVVVHPSRPEIEDGNNDLDVLLRHLREHGGIRVVDLYEYYRRPNGIPRDRILDYYWQHDMHHNARGYELFARGVAEALVRWDLVGRARPGGMRTD